MKLSYKEAFRGLEAAMAKGQENGYRAATGSRTCWAVAALIAARFFVLTPNQQESGIRLRIEDISNELQTFNPDYKYSHASVERALKWLRDKAVLMRHRHEPYTVGGNAYFPHFGRMGQVFGQSLISWFNTPSQALIPTENPPEMRENIPSERRSSVNKKKDKVTESLTPFHYSNSTSVEEDNSTGTFNTPQGSGLPPRVASRAERLDDFLDNWSGEAAVHIEAAVGRLFTSDFFLGMVREAVTLAVQGNVVQIQQPKPAPESVGYDIPPAADTQPVDELSGLIGDDALGVITDTVSEVPDSEFTRQLRREAADIVAKEPKGPALTEEMELRNRAEAEVSAMPRELETGRKRFPFANVEESWRGQQWRYEWAVARFLKYNINRPEVLSDASNQYNYPQSPVMWVRSGWHSQSIHLDTLMGPGDWKAVAVIKQKLRAIFPEAVEDLDLYGEDNRNAVSLYQFIAQMSSGMITPKDTLEKYLTLIGGFIQANSDIDPTLLIFRHGKKPSALQNALKHLIAFGLEKNGKPSKYTEDKIRRLCTEYKKYLRHQKATPAEKTKEQEEKESRERRERKVETDELDALINPVVPEGEQPSDQVQQTLERAKRYRAFWNEEKNPALCGVKPFSYRPKYEGEEEADYVKDIRKERWDIFLLVEKRLGDQIHTPEDAAVWGLRFFQTAINLEPEGYVNDGWKKSRNYPGPAMKYLLQRGRRADDTALMRPSERLIRATANGKWKT